jgi:hypothetical protein
MAIETLATTAVTILAPYVAAGGKKAAEVLGAGLAKQAEKLLSKMGDWFRGDQKAERALRDYELDPDPYGPVVQHFLLQKLRANPNLADELEALLDGMGSLVEVLQNVERLAGTATGLDLVKWQGTARAIQNVRVVEAGAVLTGAKVHNQ